MILKTNFTIVFFQKLWLCVNALTRQVTKMFNAVCLCPECTMLPWALKGRKGRGKTRGAQRVSEPTRWVLQAAGQPCLHFSLLCTNFHSINSAYNTIGLRVNVNLASTHYCLLSPPLGLGSCPSYAYLLSTASPHYFCDLEFIYAAFNSREICPLKITRFKADVSKRPSNYIFYSRYWGQFRGELCKFEVDCHTTIGWH